MCIAEFSNGLVAQMPKQEVKAYALMFGLMIRSLRWL